MKENNNFDKEYILFFYFTPFMSVYAITTIIFGGNSLGPYGDVFSDIQVRFFGLVILLLCVDVLYNIFIKMPRSVCGISKIKKTFKIFFTSLFFLFWMILLLISILNEIYKNNILLKILNYVIIVLCLYYQNKFIKNLN